MNGILLAILIAIGIVALVALNLATLNRLDKMGNFTAGPRKRKISRSSP